MAADGGFYETCNPHEVLLAADTTELEVSVILGPCEVFCVACDWDDSSFANIVRLQDDQSSRCVPNFSSVIRKKKWHSFPNLPCNDGMRSGKSFSVPTDISPDILTMTALEIAFF
mgnify:CR=1 FL=1